MDKRICQLIRRWLILITAVDLTVWVILWRVRDNAPVAAGWLGWDAKPAKTPYVLSRFYDPLLALPLLMILVWLLGFKLEALRTWWMRNINSREEDSGSTTLAWAFVCGIVGALFGMIWGLRGVMAGAVIVGIVDVIVIIVWGRESPKENREWMRKFFGLYLSILLAGIVMLTIGSLISGVVPAAGYTLLAVSIVTGIYGAAFLVAVLTVPARAFGWFFYRHMLDTNPAA